METEAMETINEAVEIFNLKKIDLSKFNTLGVTGGDENYAEFLSGRGLEPVDFWGHYPGRRAVLYKRDDNGDWILS